MAHPVDGTWIIGMVMTADICGERVLSVRGLSPDNPMNETIR
jgi:hypothetical protein